MIADDEIARKVKLAMMTMRHNTLAEIEDFCTGTKYKLVKYAPLLAHLAKWKAAIRVSMKRLDAAQEQGEKK